MFAVDAVEDSQWVTVELVKGVREVVSEPPRTLRQLPAAGCAARNLSERMMTDDGLGVMVRRNERQFLRLIKNDFDLCTLH